MGEVDRELAMLEQSNAALFTALAQTRAVPARPLPTVHSGEIGLSRKYLLVARLLCLKEALGKAAEDVSECERAH